MTKVKITPFKVIGISVHTSNIDGQAAKDIGQLWGRFMSEGLGGKIPNRIDENILSIYTNYEGDHMKPYDTILGCKVESLDEVPEGMVGQSFKGGQYLKYTCKGDLAKGVVYDAWLDIWSKELDRVYSADFEIYGEKAQNPADSEVDIMIAVR